MRWWKKKNQNQKKNQITFGKHTSRVFQIFLFLLSLASISYGFSYWQSASDLPRPPVRHRPPSVGPFLICWLFISILFFSIVVILENCFWVPDMTSISGRLFQICIVHISCIYIVLYLCKIESIKIHWYFVLPMWNTYNNTNS